MSPVEALQDQNGAVSAIKFERMATVDGKLKGTGQLLEFPAKTVCVAAGTSPNVTYELEFPGTFVLDERKEHFKSYDAIDDGTGHFKLEQVKAPASWIAMVREPVEMAMADEQRVFGDTLPAGLKLIG
jgi:hypothetical protein